MANDKDFIIKNAVEVSGSVKTTVGTLVSGTTAYSLVDGSYDNKSFDHSSDAGIVLGMYMKSDGTKMYLSSSGSGTYTDSIIEYDLSTAWDISTASYGANISVASQDTTPYGVFLKPDGLTMFVLGRATGSVYQYTLSTAWDVSSATYVSKSFDFTTQITLPSTGFFFKSDGSIMYVMESTASTNVNVYQYSLSTAWDVSSATYSSKSYAINDGLSASLFFTSDGTEMYHNVYSNTSGSQDIVRKHTLSTAWDISTASVSTETLDVSGQDTSPYSLWFKPDGSKLYVGGVTNDTIYQYSTVGASQTLDLSTGNYFNHTLTENTEFPLSNAGGVQSFQLEVTGGAVSGYSLSTASYADKKLDVLSQESTVMGVQFKPDGTKMYIVGSSGDEVNEYILRTAWDVTTANYSGHTFSLSSQHTNPRAMAFKSDGTVMYVTGTTADAVSQYTLSTAWDISTATYSSQFSVSSQEANPEGLFFKTDGTKMYVTGGSGDDVNEYALSTAWDVTTASYTTAFSVVSQATTPSGLSFNDTGTAMFVLNRGSNTVYEYTLSTAWDLTTASYNSVSYVLASLADPSGLTFKPDGTKMYIADYAADAIYQYNTQVDTTITWPTSIEWAGGTAPSSPPLEVKNLYAFTTNDGGTTYTGVLSAYNLS